MADDPNSNEIVDGDDVPELTDYDQSSTVAITNTSPATSDDYVDDDEPIEDYVVNMVVNEQPDGTVLSPDLINAAIAESNNGGRTSIYDSVTTALYDELNGNGTAITGGKRWWGWSWQKAILIGLVALCILGIILAVLFLVFGKKLKNKKRTPPAGSTTTTKAVVTKGISPDPKYQPVPNIV
ncbi:unnamed protein product [Adineta steineri]|uniref:Uncharacterized protein n=1 Tax=Adineta steineri TaxID=433720 RepID=A0A814EWZ4_9BILA|nr:unnamed protein product [Adineta steineri]CAF3566357.1 unnamed protein product [Adineta steineri]